jgi:hypothetical protein
MWVCYNYTCFACFYLKIKCELLLILHTFHIPTFKFIPIEGKKGMSLSTLCVRFDCTLYERKNMRIASK